MYVKKGREKMYPKLSWLSLDVCVTRTYFFENNKLSHFISSHADIRISISQ